MEEKNEINVTSTLLVAAPEYCCGNTEQFNHLTGVTVFTPLGFRDNVQIVLLNCESGASIKGFLKKLIDDLQKHSKQEIAFKYFSKILEQLNENHTAPVYRALKYKAEQLVGPVFSATENMIYICTNKRMKDLPVCD